MGKVLRYFMEYVKNDIMQLRRLFSVDALFIVAETIVPIASFILAAKYMIIYNELYMLPVIILDITYMWLILRLYDAYTKTKTENDP